MINKEIACYAIRSASSNELALLSLVLDYIESCPYEECAVKRIQNVISESYQKMLK